jgi:hypothetical protein
MRSADSPGQWITNRCRPYDKPKISGPATSTTAYQDQPTIPQAIDKPKIMTDGTNQLSSLQDCDRPRPDQYVRKAQLRFQQLFGAEELVPSPCMSRSGYGCRAGSFLGR